MVNITVTFICKSTGEEERGLGVKLQRKFFKTTPFTFAINETNALSGTTVALEKRLKFGEFLFYQKFHFVILL